MYSRIGKNIKLSILKCLIYELNGLIIHEWKSIISNKSVGKLYEEPYKSLLIKK